MAIPAERPANLSQIVAARVIKEISAESDNIVIIGHGKLRQRQRGITRPQIVACVRKGTIVEGPVLNQHGNWQVAMFRHAAGEELTCVLAIDWATKLIVITAY